MTLGREVTRRGHLLHIPAIHRNQEELTWQAFNSRIASGKIVFPRWIHFSQFSQ